VKTSLFSFELPEELIAQRPTPDREDARMLVLDRRSGGITDSSVRDLPEKLEPGTLVVLNDSRVRKARIFGQDAACRSVEVLLLARREGDRWEALVGGLRKSRQLEFPGGVIGTVEDRGSAEGESRIIRFSNPIDDAYLEAHGHIPLPPYIKRPDTGEDAEAYQTVYARITGSAAAPTAGLHLTEALISALEEKGIGIAFVTLHVGLGTFLPIRSENIENHPMHEETYSIPARTVELVEDAFSRSARILAVGTTVVRALESAWKEGSLQEGEGRTGIYILPGYRFRVVNGLFTNFHTPRSSLLVLVSAFAGLEPIRRAYGEAVKRRYRFFSYGDAMLIL
jgi:S-adenosylmethionine:tRNA ribosyltransferase-isomerase